MATDASVKPNHVEPQVFHSRTLTCSRRFSGLSPRILTFPFQSPTARNGALTLSAGTSPISRQAISTPPSCLVPTSCSTIQDQGDVFKGAAIARWHRMGMSAQTHVGQSTRAIWSTPSCQILV